MSFSKSACASLERDGGNFAPLRRHRVSHPGRGGAEMRGVLGRLAPWLRCQDVAALDERSVRIPGQYLPRSNDFRATRGRIGE
jgi:hypothetical protein